MLTKQSLFESLSQLPETFSVEEVIDRVILLNKIETGSKQIKEGKGISTEQLREEVKKWSK